MDAVNRDSKLIFRSSGACFRVDDKLFNGVIRTTQVNYVVNSYNKDGFKSVDSSFYLTHKLKSVLCYVNNSVADRKFYNEHGNLFQEDIFLDRKRTIKQSIWWHSNGQLWRIEMYFNGKKSGKWYECHENENLLFEGEFKYGEKVGVWIYYNVKTKEIIREEKY